MRLSKNFTLIELTKSQQAVRLGIDNAPDDVVIARLTALAQNVLQPVRDRFGKVLVSSGYRCLALNRAIGSKDTSDHVRGFAADFEVPGVDNLELSEWIDRNLRFKQLILEFYTHGEPNSGWVHCSYDPTNLRQHSITAVKLANGKTDYVPGLVA